MTLDDYILHMAETSTAVARNESIIAAFKSKNIDSSYAIRLEIEDASSVQDVMLDDDVK